MYQFELAAGIKHSLASVYKGLDIIQSLRGHISGAAIPMRVIDASGGGGKIPVAPKSIVSVDDREIVLRDHNGKSCCYPTHTSVKGD